MLGEALEAAYGHDAGFRASEAFVCGLLHDLGKIALDAILPKSFARVVEAVDLLRGNIADVERTVIGLDHMVVGKRLAERWELPQIIRESIWLHGQYPEALPDSVKYPRMINLITLADLIVRQQHLGYSGNYSFTLSRERLIEAIGLSAASVESAVTGLVDRIESAPRPATWPDQHAGALSAGVAAGQSGTRPGQRATGRQESPAGRAGAVLRRLERFPGRASPRRRPADRAAPSARPPSAFWASAASPRFHSCPPRISPKCCSSTRRESIFESSLVDCPARPGVGVGDGPVLHAGDELDWLLAAISPRLVGDQRYWICLAAEGTCVGGVVWGAVSGEGQRLGPQAQELAAIAGGWGLALRTAQIRDEARLAEQLAEANRRLQSAQNEILLSRMMTSIGEMAAGAAHEMNNPLAVISGRSQLLAAQLADPKHKAMAHLISEQSHRLSEIISELMDFAKPVPPKIEESDLADLVAHALHDAKQHTDPADRTIELTMGDIPPVMVDPKQVAAALTEVIDNAFAATDPSKGHLAIHAAYDPYSSRVALTITDNGCGMDEATIKRAFDPFFSSKPAGRRRGLGLPKATALAGIQRRVHAAGKPPATGNQNLDSASRGQRQFRSGRKSPQRLPAQ